MKPIAFFAVTILCLGLWGCTTTESGMPRLMTKEERAIREMSLDGLKIGDRTSALSKFSQVQKVPFGRRDYDIYEIYNPNSQISLALAYFSGGTLKRLELRYFDGPSANTLTRAGGWAGLRDYLIGRFGPPSRTGAIVPVVTDVPDLKAQYAQFNGEWIFSRQNRKLNYIVFSSPSGGIGVITLQDTTPIVVEKPAGFTTRTTTSTTTVTSQPAAPNPGF